MMKDIIIYQDNEQLNHQFNWWIIMKLMEYFMLNKGKMLSTENIFNHVWKDDEDASIDLVYVYVSYLNSKLSAIGASIVIEGEEGANYHLVQK